MKRTLTVVFCVLFVCLPAADCPAQSSAPAAVAPSPASQPAVARAEKITRFQELEGRIRQAWQKGDMEDAIRLSQEQASLLPRDPRPPYNLACAHARLGNKKQAFLELRQAVKNGYADAKHMEGDADLASLRKEAEFAEVLELAKERQAILQQQAQEAEAIGRDIAAAFRQKDFMQAQAFCEKLIALQPEEAGHRYNLSCALARQGKGQEAMAALREAVKLGYSEADAMAGDGDLASLHDLPEWKELVAKVREAERDAYVVTYRKGEEIAGVKTLEGRPDGGLRWRLRMDPKATKEKPNRLIIWMHPSGGSGNEVVEKLAPMFIRHGFALLVATQKNFNYWSDGDARKYFERSVAEAAKLPGIDARRPILMGFSAGGQAALVTWSQKPGQWGGLILDAAYPITTGPKGYEPMDLPAAAGVKETPLFVLVGDKDGGAKIWRKVQQPWKDAGVPLTVEYVPDAGHQWLFGKAQLSRLEEWLDQVQAGKRPSSVPAAGEAGNKRPD